MLVEFDPILLKEQLDAVIVLVMPTPHWQVDLDNYKNLIVTKPLGYFSFVNHMYHTDAIITDSGGIQKEAYMLKKPCVMLRYETEWTETLERNWNILAGNDLENVQGYLLKEKVFIKNLFMAMGIP